MTEYWAAHGETGDLSEWCQVIRAAEDRVRVVTSPGNEGNYSYRFEIRPGDEPSGARAMLNSGISQSDGENCHLIQEGDEAFYGWSVYLRYGNFDKSDKWRLVLQFKGIHTGSPPVSLNVRNDNWLLNYRPNVESGVLHKWTAPVKKGKWEAFGIHVKWSSNPEEGFIEFKYNGEIVVPKFYTANIHIENGSPVPNVVALGIYRDSTHTTTDVLYHDGFIAGASWEEVAQNLHEGGRG